MVLAFGYLNVACICSMSNMKDAFNEGLDVPMRMMTLYGPVHAGLTEVHLREAVSMTCVHASRLDARS